MSTVMWFNVCLYVLINVPMYVRERERERERFSARYIESVDVYYLPK